MGWGPTPIPPPRVPLPDRRPEPAPALICAYCGHNGERSRKGTCIRCGATKVHKVRPWPSEGTEDPGTR